MYTLVSAIGKSFASAGRWESVDIGAMPLSQIYSSYLKVYAVLTNPYVSGQVSLDLSQIQAADGGLSMTFNEFLTQNGDAALPTSTTIPTLKPQYAEYKDGFRAGYKVQPVNKLAAPDAQLPMSEKTWLYLTKTDAEGNSIDFELFYKSCMVTINGYFHNIDAVPTAAWVMDGMVSRNLSKQNQFGLLNFQKLGSLQYVAIQPSMIYKQNSNQAYRNQMYVNLGVDITNKTVMLVLGGYLHILDPQTFFRVSATSVGINFNNLPILERYHESMQYLDFSGLPFDRDAHDPSKINVADFLSDENLVAYATMSQSFFVILDNPEVFIETEKVYTGKLTNILVSNQEPKYPLVNGHGKLADYWSVQEDGRWALTVYDNRWNQRTYNTVDWRNADCVNSARTSQEVSIPSRAFFLKIGTDFDSGTSGSTS
jgi:hypothetical protein